MDIIKQTRELGKAIQQTEAYITYAACKQKNDEDEALQKMIGDFNLLRMSLSNEISKPEEQKDIAYDGGTVAFTGGDRNYDGVTDIIYDGGTET